MRYIRSLTGQVFGGILLVSGCCIGSGMLALPISTGVAGFVPSILVLFITWLFMLSTGLMILELNIKYGQDVNLATMAELTLGFPGKVISWGTFLFLFYCVMVAYSVGSGALFVSSVEMISGKSIAPWAGSLFFVMLFGACVYLGTGLVDHFNRVLMIGLVSSYCFLITAGISEVDTNLLANSNWEASPFIVPVAIVGFGFHQLVPTLTAYFEGDSQKMKKVIVGGCTIPLLVYIFWETLVLGIVPLEGEGGIRHALMKGETATQTLLGFLESPWLIIAAQSFAFFALVTSFLGVSLSFVDFLADGLKVNKTGEGKVFLCGLVMLPPFVISLTYPGVFLTALDYAGGFGAALLFGVLPPLMVWSARYRDDGESERCFPGGKKSLLAVLIFACAVIFFKLFQEMGWTAILSEADTYT
ncbi:MAG: tyrosine-specific transport protein [Chlamydiales bacterium]|jgi:tyrosine-specific transport protein